jgi:microcystin-dependent protein
MAQVFLGQILQVGFNFAPRGFALCQGQLLPISQNTALFSLLGTTFGGDGRTTFGLPDLRGRISKHPGNGPGLGTVTWGERGGRENVTLTDQNMPSHTHSANGTTDEQNAGTLQGNVLGAGPSDGRGGFTTTIYASSASANATMTGASLANAGGGQNTSLRNPYLGIYHVIAVQGIYPSRS